MNRRPHRTWRLDTVLGVHGATEAVHGLTAVYMREDNLSEEAATRLARDLLATGTAWQLARVGQIWRLHDAYQDIAEYSPRWIRVTAVWRACAQGPARVAFADLDPDDGHPWRTAGYLRIEDLAALYALTAWPNPPTRKER